MQQDRGVLADRVEDHRFAEHRGGLAQGVDRLGFELLQIGDRVRQVGCSFHETKAAGRVWRCSYAATLAASSAAAGQSNRPVSMPMAASRASASPRRLLSTCPPPRPGLTWVMWLP